MLIEVDLKKRLGAFRLAARFSSEAGVTALFGRSGSGKTTLLNVIAGLLRPDSGRIAVDGTVFYDSGIGINIAAHRRRIGYVFQEGRLLPHLSVRQNLLYGRFFTPGRDRYESLERVIALLDIGHLLERRPPRLSGGEKQRVAIGRALLASPRILLLDEPLAALDSARKTEILYYIERLRDEVRIPIIYVSHAIEEVVRLADTLVLVSGGAVAGVGPVQELTARLDLRPQLGRFEGGAVLEARVVEQDLASGLARLEFRGGILYAPDLDALVGETVRVRIRTRDVSLALAPPRDVSFLNIIAGTVAALGDEPGASVNVRLDVSGTALVARITRKSVAALGLTPGKPVYALVKAVAIDRHSVGFA